MPVNFQADVVERSHQVPVLVDFWAPWCGPCRVLGPVLDKLAGECNGAWELKKVNTDEEPALAQRYQIRGIPAVKLFVKGVVIKSFTGVMGEAQVRTWLREALPSPLEKQIRKAQAAIDAHNPAAARTMLEDVLREAPNHADARLMLAALLAFEDLPRAAALVEGLEPGEPVVQSIQILSRFQSEDSLPAGPARPMLLDVRAALSSGDWERALLGIIGALQKDRFYMNDAPRKLGVAIFSLLGPQHPLTQRHRRTFDMWLY